MRSLILLFQLCLLSVSLNAQLQYTKASKWQVKKFAIGLNSTLEMPINMNAGTFYGMKGENVPSDVSNYFNDGDLVSMQCDNAALSIGFTLLPPAMTNTELNVAIISIEDRIDMMVFENQDGSADQSQMSMKSLSDEISLDLMLTKRHPVNRWINLYGGLGLSTGLSYNHTLCIEGQVRQPEAGQETVNRSIPVDDPTSEMTYRSFEECGAVGNGLNQRLYLQGGIGFLVFKRVELGIDYRKGIGYRSNFGGDLYGVTQHSLGLSLRWVYHNGEK
ncbi:MAG: hypothetical protein AAF990_11160 [Bacteroidota bacterium]